MSTSLLFLLDIFTGCRILGWSFCLSEVWKYSIAFWPPWLQLGNDLNGCFFLGNCNLSFTTVSSLLFSSLIHIYLSIDVFGLILFFWGGSLSFLNLWFVSCTIFFSHIFFFIIFLYHIISPPFLEIWWQKYYTCNVLSQVPETFSKKFISVQIGQYLLMYLQSHRFFPSLLVEFLVSVTVLLSASFHLILSKWKSIPSILRVLTLTSWSIKVSFDTFANDIQHLCYPDFSVHGSSALSEVLLPLYAE